MIVNDLASSEAHLRNLNAIFKVVCCLFMKTMLSYVCRFGMVNTHAVLVQSRNVGLSVRVFGTSGKYVCYIKSYLFDVYQNKD